MLTLCRQAWCCVVTDSGGICLILKHLQAPLASQLGQRVVTRSTWDDSSGAGTQETAACHRTPFAVTCPNQSRKKCVLANAGAVVGYGRVVGLFWRQNQARLSNTKCREATVPSWPPAGRDPRCLPRVPLTARLWPKELFQGTF